MRLRLAAALAVLACAAIPQAPAQQSQGWSYAYADGVATVTETNERGDVIATMTCAPPTGDIIVTDYTFGNEVRRADHADVAIGQMSVNVPATVERARGRGRRFSVTIHLPQRPPILAAIQERDQLSIAIGGRTRVMSTGGPKQMKDLAYACWRS